MTKPMGRVRRGLAIAAGVTAALAVLGGVNVASAASHKKKEKIEVTFDLSKCQEQGPNLYKCPSIDKPVCTKDFNQPNVECIHIGKKGSVFVMTPGGGED
jgi:hypothetical protein